MSEAASARSVEVGRGPMLSVSEFRQIRDFVFERSGIHLHDGKMALVQGRLHRLVTALGLRTFGEYFEVAQVDPAEAVRLMDAICTNETHFFRDQRQFDFLRDMVFPELQAEVEAGRRSTTLDIWSAAASTGQEPYSLAMWTAEYLPGHWGVRILGTDLSTKVLAVAREATWDERKMGEIPEPLLHKYMLRGVRSQSGRFRAAPTLRDRVDLRQLNLTADHYGTIGSFDIIFCRNVLIYFDPSTKERVISGLLRHLRPGGYLFFGTAESLLTARSTLRSVAPSTYRHQADLVVRGGS